MPKGVIFLSRHFSLFEGTFILDRHAATQRSQEKILESHVLFLMIIIFFIIVFALLSFLPPPSSIDSARSLTVHTYPIDEDKYTIIPY